MYNPWRRKTSIGNKDIRVAASSMPGILERSKTIKKRKRIVNVVEEDEEGAEPSIGNG